MWLAFHTGEFRVSGIHWSYLFSISVLGVREFLLRTLDGFVKKKYPGKEKEMFEKLSKTQPVGRMGNPQEIADLALFLCADEASFITGSNYGIDGGYVTLNSK